MVDIAMHVVTYYQVYVVLKQTYAYFLFSY